LISGPVIAAGASGFLQSADWEAIKPDLLQLVCDLVNSQRRTKSGDLNHLRTTIREQASKLVRSRLQAKPVMQVILHEVTTP
jgi:hypothetical protein